VLLFAVYSIERKVSGWAFAARTYFCGRRRAIIISSRRARDAVIPKASIIYVSSVLYVFTPSLKVIRVFLLWRRRAVIISLLPSTEFTARTTSTGVRRGASPSPLRMTTSRSLRAGTTMRGSCAAGAPAFHSLPLATFAHVFDIINGVGVEPVSRSTAYTVVLISVWMILTISSLLVLSLWGASFTRRSSAFTRFSAASIKIIVVSRAFSTSRAVTRLKKVVFSVLS
jgi:hypothetical protein